MVVETVSPQRSPAAGKTWVGLLWPLKGQKPGNRRQMLQMEDREFWSTPTEKYEEVDVFNLSLRMALPVRGASAGCPGNGFTLLRQGTKLDASQTRGEKVHLDVLGIDLPDSDRGLNSTPAHG